MFDNSEEVTEKDTFFGITKEPDSIFGVTCNNASNKIKSIVKI